jgi:hypothetical protein
MSYIPAGKMDSGAETPDAAPAEVVETHQEAEEKHFEPRGAFTFVLLLLLFYLAYYILMYVQVFVQRGG